MMKTTTNEVSKNWLKLLLILLFFAAGEARSQTVTIGSGSTSTTSTGADPINGYYERMRYQVVYTAAELIAAGLPPGASLTGLGWSVSGDYGGGNLINYTIRLAHTAAPNSATHNTATLSTVKNAHSYNPTVVPEGSFDMITFDNNFTWNGTDNILVDVCTGNNPYTAPYGQVRTMAASTTSGSRSEQCDVCSSLCGTATTDDNGDKPQVRFSFLPPPCSNTPVAGTARQATPIACGGTGTTLIVTGDQLMLDLVYQWQESFSASGPWSDVAMETDDSMNVSAMSVITPKYFRRKTTCTTSALDAYSVPVLVGQVTAGMPAIGSSVCNDSTVLILNGVSSGTITYQWEESPDAILWTPVAVNGTSATLKVLTPATFHYYRCVVTCPATSSTETSPDFRLNNTCNGFGYSVARNTSVPYTTIQTTGSTFVWNNAFTGDDDRTNPVYFPAGFNFSYAGAVRPAFYVCTNGWLSFDTTVYNTYHANELAVTAGRLMLAPFWEDLVVLGNTAANKSYIRYEVSGTAPNRVMTIEWAEMERFNYGSPNLNFQVKLYEGTNNIEYVYGKMQPFDGSGTGDFTHSIGMIGTSLNNGQRLSLMLENTTNFSPINVNDLLPLVPSCNTSYLFTAGGAANYTNTSAVPANDNSASPAALTVNAVPCVDGCGTYYTSKAATASAVGVAPVTSNPDDDVWFRFTAPVSGQVAISVFASSGYDPAFQVMTTAFDSTGLGSAWEVNSNTSALEQKTVTGLTASTDYLIRVYHAGANFGSTSGAFSICVNEVIPAPANDDTSGAIMLAVGSTCSPVAGTTFGATGSPQVVCGGLADDDVWYKFTPTSSVDTIRVDGSGTFRPHVQILTSQLTSLYCQNNNTNGGEVVITATGLMKDSIYFIRVYHTNAGAASSNFTVCVSGITATTPLLTTGSASNVTIADASLSATITSNGGYPVTASGILLSMSPNPTVGGFGVTDSATNPVVTSGNYSLNVSGLTASTTYYVRAYAINSVGIGYGADITFTTPATATTPAISTADGSNILETTATLGGSIANNGGLPVTASGVVYSTTPMPFIGGFGVVDSTTNPVVTSGAFSFNVTGLTPATKYYYRAYAVNGMGIGYGLEDSILTSPIVSTLPYAENFDITGQNTGWHSVAAGGVNDWVLGTPAKTTINGAYSGTNAWVTRLTGNYNIGNDAAVVSPRFDFTAQTADPILRFRHKFSILEGIDGGVVEISINGGTWTQLDNTVGTGANFNTATSTSWYNVGANGFWTPTIGANFAGSSADYSSQSAGWIQSSVQLTGAAGQADVKVRMRFASTIYNFFGADEGWAIDNIEVFPPTTPDMLTGTHTNVTLASATLAGRIVYNGNATITASGIVYSTSPAPVRGGMGVVDSATNPLVASGPFTVNVTGLAPATIYYYRAYAQNGMGLSYGADSTFTTNATVVPPTLSLTNVTMTQTAATAYASIGTDGGSAITASGIVYSTAPNPLVSGVGVVDSTTNPVVVSGSYSLDLGGLTPGTKYYVKAYATNVSGTGYSVEDSFYTDPIITSLPYSHNFETVINTGWKGDWTLATPAKTFLNAAHSGTRAWLTTETGNYPDAVYLQLMSPQFNFAGLTEDPVVRFYQKFITEPAYDGLYLEMSVDGGTTWNKIDDVSPDGDNFNTDSSYAWYNNTDVNGPAAPPKFSSFNEDEGSDLIFASQVNGWIQTATRLTGAAGQSNVRFRFVFESDGSVNHEGWAIDDIDVLTISPAPAAAATAVTIIPANTTADVSWTNGSGEGRIVVARLTSTPAVAPTNWVLYNGDALATGDSTGTGNYVVYNGTGTSVTATGLAVNTSYTFDVYEYSGRYMHVKFGAAASSNTTTTPVKLVNFTATSNSGNGYLNWSTASEKNNLGFNVERSVDGKNFEFIGFVKGANNSSSLKRYAYSDARVFSATGANRVYYRLKQLDRDGRFEYSNVVSISEEQDGNFAVKAYPVPFAKDVTLNISASAKGAATISVMDIQGRVITVNTVDLEEGENAIAYPAMNDLNAGVYFVKVAHFNNTQTIRVVKFN